MQKRTIVYTATIVTMAGMVAIWFWMLPYSLEIKLDESSEVQNITQEIDTTLGELRTQIDGAGAVLGETATETNVDTDIAPKTDAALSGEEVVLSPEQLEILKQQLQQTAEANQN